MEKLLSVCTLVNPRVIYYIETTPHPTPPPLKIHTAPLIHIHAQDLLSLPYTHFSQLQPPHQFECGNVR
jgi:hypothetical protein